MDKAWWDVYLNQVNTEFTGDKFTTDKQLQKLGINYVDINAYGNSGAAAIALAVYSGAKDILLLGYDCQKTNGLAHWHGDHPPMLGNAKKIDKWHDKFYELKKDFDNINIINCTRDTALDMFKRMELENAIATING